MAGSVWEWTADVYNLEFYANSPAKNPVSTEGEGDLSIRGGSFSDRIQGSNNLRTTARTKQAPYNGIDYLGFRCAQ